MVGPLPPPVMGMAVAVENLAEALRRRTTVVTLDVAVARTKRDLRYHLARACRVVATVARLIPLRATFGVLYVACNAGHGMWYTAVLVAGARLLGYELYLHHHAYSYVARRTARFGVLLRLAGPGCHHLVYCDRMRQDLRHSYGRAIDVGLLSIAYVLDRPGSSRQPREGDLVVGHLSNLCEAKGLGRVSETVEHAEKTGLRVRLVLAGPVFSPTSEPLLEQVLDRLGPRVEYRGPVTGEAKQRFLDDIDVFLFPSRYDNESFALVVWEAMARGRPVITFRAGCLTPEAVAAGGVVLEQEEDFSSRASAILRSWRDDPAAWSRASEGAVAAVARVRSQAGWQVDQLARVAGAGPAPNLQER